MNKVSKKPTEKAKAPEKKKMRLNLEAKELEQVQGGLLCFFPPDAIKP